MKRNRSPLTNCVVAALLAGCGGSQPLIGVPDGAPLRPSSSTFQVLADFDGSDGAYPTGLAVWKNHLYGTTVQGGSADLGVLYQVSASGAIDVLYSFNGNEGSKPTSRPTADGNALYGTTELSSYDGGYGIVYKYADGQFTTLAEFPGYPSGGAYPNGLTLLNGSLYGTTQGGGSSAVGTVFVLTASGIKTIYNFPDEQFGPVEPTSALTACDGALYGTTLSGGAYSYGTVYKVTTSGQESLIHSFGAPHDGKQPLGGLVNVNGKLYGTTYYGGRSGAGTIFELSPPGAEHVLFDLGHHGATGDKPLAGLIYFTGQLYGTTSSGGAYGNGTIFSFSPSGKKLQVVHAFGASFGSGGSSSSLITFDNALYGTAASGGPHGDGTIFRQYL